MSQLENNLPKNLGSPTGIGQTAQATELVTKAVTQIRENPENIIQIIENCLEKGVSISLNYRVGFNPTENVIEISGTEDLKLLYNQTRGWVSIIGVTIGGEFREIYKIH